MNQTSARYIQSTHKNTAIDTLKAPKTPQKIWSDTTSGGVIKIRFLNLWHERLANS